MRRERDMKRDMKRDLRVSRTGYGKRRDKRDVMAALQRLRRVGGHKKRRDKKPVLVPHYS